MIVTKPSIVIYAHEPDAVSLRNVCAGIEEEGVLFQVDLRDETDPVHLANAAAQDSILGSGVGLSGCSAVLQLRGCPADRPVFHFDNAAPSLCRSIGADSARAIKKLPFKTEKGADL